MKRDQYVQVQPYFIVRVTLWTGGSFALMLPVTVWTNGVGGQNILTAIPKTTTPLGSVSAISKRGPAEETKRRPCSRGFKLQATRALAMKKEDGTFS